jgi:glutathione S-transferase
MEFSSATLNAIGAMYTAPDAQTLDAKVGDLRAKFELLESNLRPVSASGSYYFAGEAFSVVDSAFAPVFRYFDVFDTIEDFGVFRGTPKVAAWRSSLEHRASVQGAVRGDYPALLREFLLRRRSELSRRMGL